MLETDEEVAWLQETIDRSRAAGGSHLLSIAHDGRWLSARQVIAALAPGTVHHLAVATVTADGRPLVSMADGQLVHARLCHSSDGSSLKMRHVSARPQVSAVHARGDDLAVTVHGEATLHRPGSEWFEVLEGVFLAQYGSSPRDWCEDPVFAVIEPRFVLAYAMDASSWSEGGGASRARRPGQAEN